MADDQPLQPTQPATLLAKYEIPLSHLDFDYIRECNSPKEIERIYRILKSQEEGHYPDLTNCAEERLKLLKPNSRYLRRDEPLMQRSMLDENQRKIYNSEMGDWINNMKQRDGKLRKTVKNNLEQGDCNANLPPIRQFQQVDPGKQTQPQKKSERIAATEYDKWDKYDAEAEALKLDLEEEKNREMVQLKNKKNLEKSKIEEIFEPQTSCLSDIEKEELAKRFKEAGNDFYNVGEYSEAIIAYNKSIKVLPTAVSYNNRAITYIKMHNYTKAVDDCESCLKIDPGNLKAMLRKAQALIGNDMRRDAYQVYLDVLNIDPTNSVALKGTDEIRSQLPNLPPPNSVRMKIIDQDNIDEEEFSEQAKPPILKTETKYLDFDKDVDAQKVHKTRWLIEEDKPKNEFERAFQQFAAEKVKKKDQNIKISSDILNAPCKKGALIQELK